MAVGKSSEIIKGKKPSIAEIPSNLSKRIFGIADLRNDDSPLYTNDKHGTEADYDDILIAWDGANAGTIGYGKKGYIGSTIARLRIKDSSEYYSPFIGMLLKTQFAYLRGSTTGATIPHISKKTGSVRSFDHLSSKISSQKDFLNIPTFPRTVPSSKHSYPLSLLPFQDGNGSFPLGKGDFP